MSELHLGTGRSAVLRIVATYAIFGGMWIYLSDYALGLYAKDSGFMMRIATYKGLLFITLTSSLLYFLIWRFAKDINKKNEQLKKSEDRFQSIFHGISDAVFIHDVTTGKIVSANRTASEMFGYTFEEVLSMDVVCLSQGTHPYSQNEALEWLNLTAQGTPQKFEWRSKRKDGSIFWSEISMSVEMIGDNRQIIVSVRDISERKKAEEMLSLSEEKFAIAFRATPDAINLNRLKDGTYFEINEGFTSITGFLPEDVIGRSSLELGLWVNHEDRALLIKELEEHGVVKNFEARFKRKDGTTLLGHMSACIIVIKEEKYILSITRDITERENSQNELLKIQKLESLGVLAGGIAHDFNNILTGITGNISFARMFLDESHRSFKILMEAEKASQIATDLAHQLLTFAKGGAPVRKAVSSCQVIEESVLLALRGSNVQHSIHTSDDLLAVEVDEGQINQAFNNILINSAQSMPGGGNITISAENMVLDSANAMSLNPGNYVKFTFTDTGCGMSEETQKQIFDPYFTTKARGSGLGLASVYSIVKKHGGHISVISALHQGTSFTILLPASSQQSIAKACKETPQLSNHHVGVSLLVMDDEEMIRDMTSEMLGELGYHVQTCVNGDEAITLYKAAKDTGSPFWAVIMDLTIPGGMGGKEAARQIFERGVVG